MIAAEGYPDNPVKGDKIKIFEAERGGLTRPGDPDQPRSYVLHAGTAIDTAGELVSAGGRVLNVVGSGPDIAAARAAAYQRPTRSPCVAAGTATTSPRPRSRPRTGTPVGGPSQGGSGGMGPPGKRGLGGRVPPKGGPGGWVPPGKRAGGVWGGSFPPRQ